jgi:vancomycin resistance protein YoaR
MPLFPKSGKIERLLLRPLLTKINRRSIFLAVCLLLLSLFSLILADGLISLGQVHSGIKIGDVYVGSLTPQQAKEKLESRLNPALHKPVEIKYESNSRQITPGQFDVRVSIQKSVDKAYAIGREGGLIQQIRQRFSCWLKTRKSVLIYSVDSKLISDYINQIAADIDRDPVDAGISLAGGDAKITPSQIGISLDKPQMFSMVKTKLVASRQRIIVAPVTIIPVDITEDDAKDAFKDTKRMMRYPLTLNYKESIWQFDSKQIGELIRFKKIAKTKAKTTLKLQAELDPDKVKDGIGRLTEDLNVEPQNAEFQVDGASVNIVPSKNGIKVDTDSALEKLNKEIFADPPRQIVLSTKVVEPERTTEEAQAMGIKERVSSFTTTFSSGNPPRVNNIRLLSQALDGVIVAPGKVFSFNDATGPRTAEKGYQEAPTIVQGELVPSIGGGICQVATTLFNTIFLGGYPVTSRQNHSFYISHYPDGRDATVSWGGPDLKFKNDTEAYLLIKTWPSSSSITVAIYSTDYDTVVSYKATEFSNYKAFPIKKVDDPSLPKEQEVIETAGIEGRDITVYRTVKRGGNVLREDKFFSRYKPKAQVVRIGTMEAAPAQEGVAEETQTAQ